MTRNTPVACNECGKTINFLDFKFKFHVKTFLHEGRCQSCQDKETEKWEDHRANQESSVVEWGDWYSS